MNKEIFHKPEYESQETPEQREMSEQLRKIAEGQEQLDKPKSLKDFDASIDKLVAGQPGETEEDATQRISKVQELRDERDEYYQSLFGSLVGKKLPKKAQAPITERAEIDEEWREAVKKWRLEEKVLPDERFPDDRRMEFLKRVREAEYKIEEAIIDSGEVGQKNKQESGIDAEVNDRQQNKIIKILETGDADTLNQSVVRIPAKERASALEKIKSGEFSEEKLRAVVHEVAPAYKDKEFSFRLADIREKEGHEEGLFKRYISLFDNPGDRRGVTFKVGFQRFLESCPTVDVLQDKIDTLISEAQAETENKDLIPPQREMIKAKLTLRKQLRGRDFEEFTGIVYGKQKEYWDQVKLLKQEARG